MATERWLFLVFTLYSVMTAGFTGDLQCQVGKLSKSYTVPRGGLKVSSMEVLGDQHQSRGTVSAEYCISQCCQLGPSKCQFMWVIWGSCFAVACQPGSDLCDPVTLQSSSSIESIFVQMLFPDPPVATPISPERERVVTHSDQTGGDERVIDETDGEDSNGVGGASSEVGGVGDYPPVADAGNDVVVVLPENSVKLYGNASTDDKGIVYYLWQLTSEDHFSEARLVDSMSPMLQVQDLTPGAYIFTLTVVDSSYQPSTDTVLVHVLAAPSETTTATAASSEKVISTGTSTAHLITIVNMEEDATALNLDEDLEKVINSSIAELEKEKEKDDFYSKKMNLLKIVVPVLLSLAFILGLSATIVGVSACLWARSKGKMQHLYRYKQLPGTIEKT